MDRHYHLPDRVGGADTARRAVADAVLSGVARGVRIARPEERTGHLPPVAHQDLVRPSAARYSVPSYDDQRGTPKDLSLRQGRAGRREATVSFRFTDDSRDFGHLLIAALSRRTGIDRASFVQPVFSGLAEELVFRLATEYGARPGRTVKLTIGFFQPTSGPLTIDHITVVEPPVRPRPPEPPAPSLEYGSDTNPVQSARMERLRAFIADWLLRLHQRGVAGARVVLAWDGHEVSVASLIASTRTAEPKAPLASVSQARVAAALAELFALLMAGPPGRTEYEFQLDGQLLPGGRLQFKFRRVPNAPPVAQVPPREVSAGSDPEVDAIVREWRAKQQHLVDVANAALREADPFTPTGLLLGVALPIAGGYVIMNLDRVTRLGSIIRIQRYSEFGELVAEVRYVESAAAVRGATPGGPLATSATREPVGLVPPSVAPPTGATPAIPKRPIGFVEPTVKPPTGAPKRGIGFVEPTVKPPTGAPKRGIGFVEPSTKPPTGGPRPGVGFAAGPRTEPPPVGPAGEQPFTQLPPARQMPSTPQTGPQTGSPTVPRTSASGGTKWRSIKDEDLARLRDRAKTDRDAAFELAEYEQAELLEFNPVARSIAKGHAKNKHFPGTQTDDLTRLVEEVMNNPTAKKTNGNATAYWHKDSGTFVVTNPRDIDHGTVFRPDRGRAYFDDWPNVGPNPTD